MAAVHQPMQLLLCRTKKCMNKKESKQQRSRSINICRQHYHSKVHLIPMYALINLNCVYFHFSATYIGVQYVTSQQIVAYIYIYIYIMRSAMPSCCTYKYIILTSNSIRITHNSVPAAPCNSSCLWHFMCIFFCLWWTFLLPFSALTVMLHQHRDACHHMTCIINVDKNN